MSQRQNHPRSSACRRLVFDEEPAPEIETSSAAEDLQNEAEEQIPPHLEEARIDNIRNNFVEEMQNSRDEARKKWNFDFETETPLDGDWEWEKVEDVLENKGASNGRGNVQK